MKIDDSNIIVKIEKLGNKKEKKELTQSSLQYTNETEVVNFDLNIYLIKKIDKLFYSSRK